MWIEVRDPGLKIAGSLEGGRWRYSHAKAMYTRRYNWAGWWAWWRWVVVMVVFDALCFVLQAFSFALSASCAALEFFGFVFQVRSLVFQSAGLSLEPFCAVAVGLLVVLH